MKPWCLFVFLIVFSSHVTAQDLLKPCEIFGEPNFKNGVATVTITALAVDIHREPPMIKLNLLPEKQRKRYSDFYKRTKAINYSNSGLSFITDGCALLQTAPMASTARFTNGLIGRKLKLTCLVFQDAPTGFGPTFYFYSVITDVQLDPDDNKPIVSIKPLKYLDGLKYDTACAVYGNTPGVFAKLTSVVVMTNENEAIMKKSDESLMKFKRDKHTPTRTGYIDHFTGDAGTFELNINRFVYSGNKQSYRFGHLTVKLENTVLSLDVFGDDREKDDLNGY